MSWTKARTPMDFGSPLNGPDHGKKLLPYHPLIPHRPRLSRSYASSQYPSHSRLSVSSFLDMTCLTLDPLNVHELPYRLSNHPSTLPFCHNVNPPFVAWAKRHLALAQLAPTPPELEVERVVLPRQPSQRLRAEHAGEGIAELVDAPERTVRGRCITTQKITGVEELDGALAVKVPGNR